MSGTVWPVYRILGMFRPHSGIGGSTLAEKLGLVIKTATGKITDKWITVIRHATCSA